MAADYKIKKIDAMRIENRYAISNVSAGISSRAMGGTKTEDKQKKGMLAYIETIAKDLAETEPVEFTLNLDGRPLLLKAIEVMVTNGNILKENLSQRGSPTSYSDGKLEVHILRSIEPLEIVNLAWELLIEPPEPKERPNNLSVEKSIWLNTPGKSFPVQADGDIITKTPVEIHLVPRSVNLIVPK